MKKIAIISAVIAGLAALVSCNKEEIAVPQYGTMSVTLNYDDVDGKTTFTRDGTSLSHVWKAGDEISVIITNGLNEKFTLACGAGTKSATFTCENNYLSTITKDTYVKIVYPYTDKTNPLATWWVSDISDQGSGSIDNLGKYDVYIGTNCMVTYVEEERGSI